MNILHESSSAPVAFELLATGEVPTRDQAVELLSYSDVLIGQERVDAIAHTFDSSSGLKYADTLIDLVETHGAEVQVLVDAVRLSFNRVNLSKLNVQPSKFSDSQSWILWDLVKQKYLVDHPEESSENYTLADPFSKEGEFKIDEIADRHIGWELNRAVQQGEIEIRKLRVGLLIPSILRLEHRNEGGELPSHSLEKLGAEVRKYLTSSFVASFYGKAPNMGYVSLTEWYKVHAPHLISGKTPND